jgi:hypothetical protein
MNEIRGFKGFDKDLKCKGFQYEVGQTYQMEGLPKLCTRGYHFSPTLKQAMTFYPQGKDNRWCEVLAIGDIEVASDKIVTNHVKIVREITASDICAEIDGINLLLLKDACNNGGIICGSLALKMQGFDLCRPIKDIDFIFPDEQSVNNVFKTFEIAALGSVIHESNRNVSGRRAFYDREYSKTYDVFIKNDTYREVSYYGEKLKVSDPLKIWNEKLRYAFGGSMKHANDFHKFSHRLSFLLVVTDKVSSESDVMSF